MKMQFKKFTAIALAFCMASMCAVPSTVKAATDYSYYDSDVSEKESTKGKLALSTKFTISLPVICHSVKSKGNSKMTFSANGTGYTYKYVSHKLTAKIGGIGIPSIATNTGVVLSSSSSKIVLDCRTKDCDYTIHSEITLLYTYSETGSHNYEIKKNSTTKAIFLETQAKYGL